MSSKAGLVLLLKSGSVNNTHTCGGACGCILNGSVVVQSEHGGHTNAYTAAESTNYHFDCNWDSLEEALDRFAQVESSQHEGHMKSW